MNKWVSIAAMALAFGFVTAPASAAPTGIGVQAADRASVVEPVGYRTCRWYKGQRVCRWVEGYYGYGPSVGVYLGDGDRRGFRRGDRGRR